MLPIWVSFHRALLAAIRDHRSIANTLLRECYGLLAATYTFVPVCTDSTPGEFHNEVDVRLRIICSILSEGKWPASGRGWICHRYYLSFLYYCYVFCLVISIHFCRFVPNKQRLIRSMPQYRQRIISIVSKDFNFCKNWCHKSLNGWFEFETLALSPKSDYVA